MYERPRDRESMYGRVCKCWFTSHMSAAGSGPRLGLEVGHTGEAPRRVAETPRLEPPLPPAGVRTWKGEPH